MTQHINTNVSPLPHQAPGPTYAAPSPTASLMGKAAEWYAQHGFEVFPLHWVVEPAPRGDFERAINLPPDQVAAAIKAVSKLAKCSCQDPECKSVGKHPLGQLVPKGVGDATSDLAKIREWWSAAPAANIGLRIPKRTIVLDFDFKQPAARQCLEDLKRRGLPMSWVNTSGHGCHVFLSVPEATTEFPSSFGGGEILHHQHRYAVAPPSTHFSGNQYHTNASELIAPQAPSWLVEALPTWRGLTRARGADMLASGATGGDPLAWLRIGKGLQRRPDVSPLDWFRYLVREVLPPPIFADDPRSTEAASITLQRAAHYGLTGLELDPQDVEEILRNDYAPRCLGGGGQNAEGWDFETPHRAREFERLVRTAGKGGPAGYLQPTPAAEAQHLADQDRLAEARVKVARNNHTAAKQLGDAVATEQAARALDAEKQRAAEVHVLALEAKQRAKAAPVDVAPPQGDAQSDKAQILVNGDEHRVNDEALAALARSGSIYSRSFELVELVSETNTEGESAAPYNGHVIREVPSPIVRHKLSEYAAFYKVGSKGQTCSAQVPEWCVAAIHKRGEWPGVRRLVGLLETPAVRPDGSVIQAPGYDAATGYYLADGAPIVNVAERPTQEDARRAYAELADVFCDFAYVSEADRAVPIAAILTLLARPAIKGAVPAFVFDAPTPGSGKGLQLDAIGTIVFGRTPAKKTWPAGEEERDKVLAAYAVKGVACICFDNIDTPFGGQALNACLTARDTVELRVLGKTEVPTLTWRAVVLGSGNNVEIPAESGRRVFRATINPKHENPSERAGSEFKHYPLLSWVASERARLIEAALTVLRAHAVAGRPSCNVGTIGSFEEWSAVVGAAVAFAGGPDLAPLLRANAAGDPKRDALATLWRTWAALDPEGRGLICNAFLAQVRGVAGMPSAVESAGVLEALSELDIEPQDARALGKLLRKHRGRVFNGLELNEGTADGHAKICKWVVRRV